MAEWLELSRLTGSRQRGASNAAELCARFVRSAAVRADRGKVCPPAYAAELESFTVFIITRATAHDVSTQLRSVGHLPGLFRAGRADVLQIKPLRPASEETGELRNRMDIRMLRRR